MEIDQIAGALEAILFVSGDPVERETVIKALEITDLQLNAAVERLSNELNFNMRGLTLLTYADKLQLATRQEYLDYVERALSPVRSQPLSAALLETLSVISYRQPITKSDIEQIRGVKCDYSVQTLQKLGLIEEKGRMDTLGRPILYGTTDAFLRHFGLSRLSDLPELTIGMPADFEEPV